MRNTQIQVRLLTVQGPVVLKVDNAVQWLNLYPVDSAIDFPNTYPMDTELSGGLRYPTFEQPEP